MVCYFKRICGINQAEDRVTWPDLLPRHTIALASFREWSVVSARLWIRAQPRNPCRARNSASAWTWWPVIGCSKAGRRTLDDPSASADHPMTGHRTPQTSGRRPSAVINQIWFPAENWLPPKIAREKELFWNLNNVMYENYFCGYLIS